MEVVAMTLLRAESSKHGIALRIHSPIARVFAERFFDDRIDKNPGHPFRFHEALKKFVIGFGIETLGHSVARDERERKTEIETIFRDFARHILHHILDVGI